MARRIIWTSALLIYSAFFAWYTNFDGPLKDNEIEKNLQVLRDANAPPERIKLIEEFMRTDTGNDLVMVNSLDLNDSPPDLPATGPGADANALLDHYMEHMYPAQFTRASHPLFFGKAIANAMDISGIEGADHWEVGALFRYRSRRDVLEISLDSHFTERHEYKMAALTKTIAYPVEAMLNPADLRFILGLIIFSFTSFVDLLIFRRSH